MPNGMGGNLDKTVSERKAAEIFSLYCLSIAFGLTHLLLHTRFARRLDGDVVASAAFLSGVGAILSFHLVFLRLWNLWSELGSELSSVPAKTVLEKREVSQPEVIPLKHVVEVPPSSIKVLFSHPDAEGHETFIKKMKQRLARDLGSDVEVVAKTKAKETLFCATDNVFDLILIASHYEEKDLKAHELCAEIKRLDRNIPVVVLAQVSTPQWQGSDGWLLFSKDYSPLSRIEEYLGAKSRTHTA